MSKDLEDNTHSTFDASCLHVLDHAVHALQTFPHLDFRHDTMLRRELYSFRHALRSTGTVAHDVVGADCKCEGADLDGFATDTDEHPHAARTQKCRSRIIRRLHIAEDCCSMDTEVLRCESFDIGHVIRVTARIKYVRGSLLLAEL